MGQTTRILTGIYEIKEGIIMQRAIADSIMARHASRNTLQGVATPTNL
jgi:hypothetical protein